MLLLTENGIIAARDKLGRTPIVVGRKEGAYAVSSESSCFPNLDYEIERYIGPGEILHITADGITQLREPNEEMQICSFLWVYYGFPTSCYENRNVEMVRFACGAEMGKTDDSEVDCACGIPDSGVGMALGYAEGKRRALPSRHLQIHANMAPKLHAEQPIDALAGGKMKLIPQSRHARRQTIAVLRRLHRARHPAARQRENALRLRSERSAYPHCLPPAHLRLPVHWLHFVEKRHGADHPPHHTRPRRRCQ